HLRRGARPPDPAAPAPVLRHASPRVGRWHRRLPDPARRVDPAVPRPRPRRRRPGRAPIAQEGAVHVDRLGQALRPPVAHRADLGAAQGGGARPMSTHHYATSLSWEGSTGLGYDRYDRGHTARVSPVDTRIHLTADPAF